jgi:hypothetical protein
MAVSDLLMYEGVEEAFTGQRTEPEGTFVVVKVQDCPSTPRLLWKNAYLIKLMKLLCLIKL